MKQIKFEKSFKLKNLAVCECIAENTFVEYFCKMANKAPILSLISHFLSSICKCHLLLQYGYI